MRFDRIGALAASICAAVAAIPAARAAVTYTTLDLHPAGHFSSEGLAISGTSQGGDSGVGLPHATLWATSPVGSVDLHPAAFSNDPQAESYVYGVSPARQAGYVSSPFNYGSGNYRAYVWSGSAASAVNLHPAGSYTSSQAFATTDAQQVGQARGAATFGQYHAALWSGTADTFVDLNPTNAIAAASTSSATAVAAGVQAGFASVYYKNGTRILGPAPHAYAWSGTAASGIDLHPGGGFDQSYINGTTGTAFAGSGVPAGYAVRHAIYWPSASADAAVDLNPVGYDYSQAFGIADGVEIGMARSATLTGNESHAFVWFGTAASGVDLHQFLPAGFTSSQAYGVTSDGYIVGYAYTGSVAHAYLWMPVGVPEPMTLGPVALAGLTFAVRRPRT